MERPEDHPDYGVSRHRNLLDEMRGKSSDISMKYTLFFAALFAFSVALHAQSEPAASGDETATAAPADPGQPQVLEAQDKKGELKETVTSTTETLTSTPAATAPAKTEAATDSSAKPTKAIVTQDLKGEIEKIDAEARTFVVAGKTFKFWSSGKVFFKRKLKTLADLKVGDKVAVTYREGKDGTLEASRINK